eukprot:COSAG02_NODE_47664_length_339_cov_1.287500_2_plen_20_part_01
MLDDQLVQLIDPARHAVDKA